MFVKNDRGFSGAPSVENISRDVVVVYSVEDCTFEIYVATVEDKQHCFSTNHIELARVSAELLGKKGKRFDSKEWDKFENEVEDNLNYSPERASLI